MTRIRSFLLILSIIWCLSAKIVLCADDGDTPEDTCSYIPRNSTLYQTCLNIQHWRIVRNAIWRAGLNNRERPSTSPAVNSSSDTTLSDLNQMYDCMDIACYCQKSGGTPNSDRTCTVVKNGTEVRYGKAKRKEYRMLTKEERDKVHHCYHALKWGPGQSTYNNYVYMHEPAMAPIAHDGPAFPIWHREFVKRFEFDMRQVDPDCAIPYWNSTMDEPLDDPRESCLWSDDLMGEVEPVNNTIINGAIFGWTTTTGYPLVRKFPNKQANNLFSAYDAADTSSYDLISMMAFTDETADTKKMCKNLTVIKVKDKFEYLHGAPHNFIGGDMEYSETSVNDPIFFMHHCYIDYLYELWRIKQNKLGNDPTQIYPETNIVDDTCANIAYSRKEPMLPFMEIKNEWGLKADYTNELYEYEPCPGCDKNKGCGSPFLFCFYDKNEDGNPISYCVSKIRLGGKCQRFSQKPSDDRTSLSGDDINPCYKGECKNVGGNWTCVDPNKKSLMLKEIMLAGKGNGKGSNGKGPKGNPGKGPKNNPGKGSKGQNGKKPKKPKKGKKPPKAKIDTFRTCFDNHECCPRWSEDGFCKNATQFMNIWCPASCACDGCGLVDEVVEKKAGKCVDLYPLCKQWKGKKSTECEDNEHWMSANCAKTCKKCDAIASCDGGPGAKRFYYSRAQLDLPQYARDDNEVSPDTESTPEPEQGPEPKPEGGEEEED